MIGCQQRNEEGNAMQNDRIRQIMTILLQEKKVIAKDLQRASAYRWRASAAI